jgi:hypothetical protein
LHIQQEKTFSIQTKIKSCDSSKLEMYLAELGSEAALSRCFVIAQLILHHYMERCIRVRIGGNESIGELDKVHFLVLDINGNSQSPEAFPPQL